MTDSIEDLLKLISPDDPKGIYNKSILKDVSNLDLVFGSDVRDIDMKNLNSITTFIEKDKPKPTFDVSALLNPNSRKEETKVDPSLFEIDFNRPNKNLKKRHLKTTNTIKPCTASSGKQVDSVNSLTLQQIIDQADENSVISVARKVYNENIKINKKLTLKAQQGFGQASVTSVSISADCQIIEINFSGFSLFGNSSSVFSKLFFFVSKG